MEKSWKKVGKTLAKTFLKILKNVQKITFIKVVKEVNFFSPLFFVYVSRGTIMIYSLNEIYASGGQLPIVALKIENADIGTLRFVLAYEDMKLDGETYHASAFTIQQPERSDSGFSDLSFSICGVNGECYQYIKQALQSRQQTLITMTEWHPETKQAAEEITLTVTGGQLDRQTANFTASFCDMLNCEFPRLKYTAYNAPGLKYIK